MPGSVTHGRYVRRRPARYAAFARRTARRVVRSLAGYGCSGSRARRRSWTMSARTLPPERSTSSSILSRYRSDEHRPADRGVRIAPGVTGPDVAGDGLGVAGGEVGCRVGAAGEIERFEDLHDLPVRLLHGPSGSGDVLGVGTPHGSPTGGIARGGTGLLEEISCPPIGRTAVRQRGSPCPPTRRLACPLSELPDGARITAFDAHRAWVLALPEAIAEASPARLEELCRIVVAKVVVRDREVQSIEWTPPAKPFFGNSGSAPKGIRTPDLHLERVAS